jgi:hypothetical protein
MNSAHGRRYGDLRHSEPGRTATERREDPGRARHRLNHEYRSVTANRIQDKP